MKKRILALIGVFFLLAMYASTMVFALIDSPRAAEMFNISLYCTIVIPVIIYAGTLIFKNAHDRKELPFEEPKTDDSASADSDDEAGK
ncbi:MAG TPA: hypothetical protein DF613_13545 [Lachnospiraceae bacterium]|nr:hypothetical protein [Lachnospiraceae bacterium]